MTNSSVKKVRNGFIRVEAIVPCAVVTGVIVAYSMLFFDGHLRKAIEWGATQANGAEVNVARVKTSFLSASIVVGGIQVTNSAEPKFNRLAIGEGRFKLSWDALLRAKIVIDEAAIEQVEIGTQRAKPGFVVPPSPPSGAFARIKDRITRSALGEAGQLLEGFDPMRQLTNVRADLKSEARVKELQSQFGAKEAQWTGAAKNLADGKEFSALQQRLQAVPTSVGNPAEIPGRVAEVNGIIKDVDAKISSVRAQGDQLLKEVNVFGSSISELDDLIKADKDGLEKLLKLPTLDARGIAEQLFGAKALHVVGQAQQAVGLVRKYMPSKKAADKKDEPLIHARAKGRVFEFPVTRGYPMFWLRKAEISSKGENSVSGGDLEGRLTDVTSNPALIGKPAVLQIKADFKKQEIRGIDVRVVVDHTRETAKETLNVKVDSFPMNAVSLSDSETLKFGLDKSVAKAGLNAELHGDKFSLILLQGFEKVNYKVSSNSKMLEETLQAIVKDIPSINVKATIAGSFDDFDLSVESNLAAALQAGFQKQLQAKLVEARKRIDGLVKERVGKEQAALVARYDSAKNQLFAQVEDKKKLAESYRAQALARLDQVKKAPAPVQKAVQQLKGRLMR